MHHKSTEIRKCMVDAPFYSQIPALPPILRGQGLVFCLFIYDNARVQWDRGGWVSTKDASSPSVVERCCGVVAAQPGLLHPGVAVWQSYHPTSGSQKPPMGPPPHSLPFSLCLDITDQGHTLTVKLALPFQGYIPSLTTRVPK